MIALHPPPAAEIRGPPASVKKRCEREDGRRPKSPETKQKRRKEETGMRVRYGPESDSEPRSDRCRPRSST